MAVVPFVCAVGLIGSTSLTAANYVISYIVMPAMLRPNAPAPLLVDQWANLYNRGKNTAIPTALSTSLCWAYLACLAQTPEKALRYGLKTAPVFGINRSLWFAFAGIQTFSIMIYTLACMIKTNNKLLAKNTAYKSGGDVKEEGTESTLELIKLWTRLNAGRATWTLVGMVAGMIAVLA